MANRLLVGPGVVLTPLLVTGGGLHVAGGGLDGGALVLLVLLEHIFGVTVEEEVHLDLPGHGTGKVSTHAENLTCEHPVQHTDGVLTTVVARDGKVHVLERGVGVTECDDRDVDVGRLGDGLVVGTGVGHDDQTGLGELLLLLVGEGSRAETSSHGGGSGVLGELEHGTLSVGTGRDDNNVSRVLNGDDGTGGQHQLLPGHVQVEHVDTVLAACGGVTLHGGVQVLGTHLHVAGKHLLDVRLSRLEDGRSAGNG